MSTEDRSPSGKCLLMMLPLPGTQAAGSRRGRRGPPPGSQPGGGGRGSAVGQGRAFLPPLLPCRPPSFPFSSLPSFSPWFSICWAAKPECVLVGVLDNTLCFLEFIYHTRKETNRK